MGTSNLIIEIAKLSGIANNPGSTYRANAKTKSGNRSHHADDNAVDFMGYSQDTLAAFFMTFPTAEVFHYSEATGKWYGSSRGHPVDAATHQDLVAEHHNHLHVAMLPDQLGPGSVLDNLRKGLIGVGRGVASAAGEAAGTFAGFINAPANITEAVGNVAVGMRSMAQSALSVGRFAEAATKIFLPTNGIRVISGILGFIFILIGIRFLAMEIKESKA